MGQKKENWKTFGKNTGNAFANFGKAMATTAKVVFCDEDNSKEENGHTKLGNAWANTGKGFGKAGKSLGKATVETFEEDKGPKKPKEEFDKDSAVDAEVEKKEQ